MTRSSRSKELPIKTERISDFINLLPSPNEIKFSKRTEIGARESIKLKLKVMNVARKFPTETTRKSNKTFFFLQFSWFYNKFRVRNWSSAEKKPFRSLNFLDFVNDFSCNSLITLARGVEAKDEFILLLHDFIWEWDGSRRNTKVIESWNLQTVLKFIYLLM